MTTLSQSAFLKGSQELTLDDQPFVRVKQRQNWVLKEFTLPLDQFDPEPSRVDFIPKQWLIGSLLFGLPLAGLIVGAVAFNWVAALVGFSIFLGPFFLICFYRLLKEKADLLVFHNRYTRANLLILWNDRPKKDTFDSFVTELRKRVSNHAAQMDSKRSEKSMVVELKELHGLLETGVLTQAEYDAGKRRILGILEPAGVIGFHA